MALLVEVRARTPWALVDLPEAMLWARCVEVKAVREMRAALIESAEVRRMAEAWAPAPRAGEVLADVRRLIDEMVAELDAADEVTR